MFQVLFVALLTLCAQFGPSTAACCLISNFIDESRSFLVPVPGVACFNIQMYTGGKIQVDLEDPTCAAQNFLPQSVADFVDYNSNIANYSEGDLGKTSTVIIMEDTSLSEIEYDVSGSGSLILITIIYPSCPSLTPLTQREALIDLYERTGGTNWYNQENWLSSENECEWERVQCEDGVNVSVLSLWQNNLEGTIPESIGYLSNLTELVMSENALTGTIPASMGDLINMRNLYLDTNELTGTIPESLSNMYKLFFVLIGETDLTGYYPRSWCVIRGIWIIADYYEIECDPDYFNNNYY